MSNPKSRWGSILSGAVAGIESKLDSILADDDQASAKSRQAEEAAKQTKKTAALKAEQDSSRASSRSRTSDRLQERLAKAVVKGGDGQRSASNAPSETKTHARDSSISIRTSLDSTRSDSQLMEAKEAAAETDQVSSTAANSTAATDAAGATTTTTSSSSSSSSARPSHDNSSSRPSVEAPAVQEPSQPLLPSALPRGASFLESELSRQTIEHNAEIHQHLERIDALHSKVAYLSAQLQADATDAVDSSPSGSVEQKSAEKDAKIAQLLQEGEKLSRNEMKHLGIIKRLRTKALEDERAVSDLKRKIEKLESDNRHLKERTEKAEERERVTNNRLDKLQRVEKDADSLRLEKSVALQEIQELRIALEDVEKRADEAESLAQTNMFEEQSRLVAELNDELSNARIEKRLVEDRVKSEMNDIKAEHTRQLDKTKLTEIELKGEILNLESKLELVRLKSEEVSANNTTDAQAKLLRQIETLQTQYALASENWQGIETSLNVRVTTLQKERDDLAKREAEVRKKAREINSKARRLEEELETANERHGSFETDLAEQKSMLDKMQAKLAAAEKEVTEAKNEIEKERQAFETKLQARIEEEKTKWRLELAKDNPVPFTPIDGSSAMLRIESPTASFSYRKPSAPDLIGHSRRSLTGSKVHSPDLLSLIPLPNDNPMRSSSRRGAQFSPHTRSPTDPSIQSRQGSISSFPQLNGNTPPPPPPPPPVPAISIPPPPSIHTIDAAEDDDLPSRPSSPQRTIGELISVSTVGAGPSVQLVERMSATVRRLEMEKATSREEMARLQMQRDEAREEVVALMREAEALKINTDRVSTLEKDVGELKGRYDAALEMLGEKSEECEELRNDVIDLKKIYRELVESTLR